MGWIVRSSWLCSKHLRLFSTESSRSRSSHHRGRAHRIVNPRYAREDCIGPLDKLSRLRPVLFYVPPNETELQTAYRLARQDTQDWNQAYWARHNFRFDEEMKAFMKKKMAELGKMGRMQQLSADEMGEFYKKFLDSTYQQHLQYNWEWYRRNFRNLQFACRVWLQEKCGSKLSKR